MLFIMIEVEENVQKFRNPVRMRSTRARELLELYKSLTNGYPALIGPSPPELTKFGSDRHKIMV